MAFPSTIACSLFAASLLDLMFYVVFTSTGPSPVFASGEAGRRHIMLHVASHMVRLGYVAQLTLLF